MAELTQKADSRWVFNTSSRHASRVIMNRLAKSFEFELIELFPDQGKGCEARISFEVKGKSWADKVLNTLNQAQSLGRSWSINGDIEDSVDLSCAEFSESGLKFMWIQMDRED